MKGDPRGSEVTDTEDRKHLVVGRLDGTGQISSGLTTRCSCKEDCASSQINKVIVKVNASVRDNARE